MLRPIPWDVWIAAVIAGVVALAAVFKSAPAIFIFLYLALCVYITVETFRGKRE